MSLLSQVWFSLGADSKRMALIYREGTPALLQERETLEVEVWREMMDSNLDQKNFWDEQSCREFERYIDDWHEAQGMEPVVRIDIPDKWPWEEENKCSF